MTIDDGTMEEYQSNVHVSGAESRLLPARRKGQAASTLVDTSIFVSMREYPHDVATRVMLYADTVTISVSRQETSVVI